MIRLKSLLIALILVLLFGCSQKENKLIGKWQFVDFYNLDIRDTVLIKQSKSLYQKYIITFDSDGQSSTDFMGKEQGDWEYDEGNHSLKITYKEGGQELLNIIKLDNQNLILTYKKEDKGFIFKKISRN